MPESPVDGQLDGHTGSLAERRAMVSRTVLRHVMPGDPGRRTVRRKDRKLNSCWAGLLRTTRMMQNTCTVCVRYCSKLRVNYLQFLCKLYISVVY